MFAAVRWPLMLPARPGHSPEQFTRSLPATLATFAPRGPQETNSMPGHRSFVPSDFSLRDVFTLLLGGGALWLIGTMSDSLPTFWKGVLCGFGLGFVLASSLRSRLEGARAAHL